MEEKCGAMTSLGQYNVSKLCVIRLPEGKERD